MNINKEFILSIQKIILPNECWIKSDNKSYSIIYIEGNRYVLHRLVAHLWHKLDLYDNRQLACHRCDNKACFNPNHIYTGSYHTNLMDVVDSGNHGQAKRTHCKLGHLLDGIKIRSSGLSERYCKSCQRLANRKHRGY